MPEVLVADFEVKLSGSTAPIRFAEAVRRIEVDASLHMPAMATIELVDSKLEWIDDTSIDIGKELEILFKGNAQVGVSAATALSVFKGVISSHEPQMVEGGQYNVMVIRAYDRLHLMHRGTQTSTFLRAKDSDIASKVIRTFGLQPQVQATTTVHEHVFQGDMTAYDFLQTLARRNGHVVVCKDRAVHWKPADAISTTTVTAEFGVTIKEFRPVLSTTGQVNEVKVEGWDPQQKRAVTASASSAKLALTTTGIGSRGPAIAQSKFVSAKLHVGESVRQQPMAEALAKSTFDRLAASDITAEGAMFGDPKILPGTKLTVQKVGNRFSGQYMVTRARHVFDNTNAYETQFWLGGMSSGTLSSLIADDPTNVRPRSSPVSGVAIGIVTNVKDPNDMGRVLVKFPWLSADSESAWAPVLGIGAGNARGFYVLPEVNDEVLVAFVNGDLNYPYVLGGLWNGQDKTPTAVGTAVAQDGKVDVREFKTRVGHILRFTDKSGEEKIELLDKTGKNTLVIESSGNKFTINCDGPMSIKAGADVKIEASAKVDIKGGAEVKISGPTVNVEASGKLVLKAPMVEITGSAMVKISAPLVKLN